MTKLAIALHPAEAEALRRLSMHQQRTRQSQAAFIIRQELIQRGLLPLDAMTTQMEDAYNERDDNMRTTTAVGKQSGTESGCRS